jgi:hypothetical protein
MLTADSDLRLTGVFVPLLLLLVLASTIILSSVSHGTHDHILLFRSVGWSAKLLLAFDNTVISGFSLNENNDQDFYSLLNMYVF